MIIDRFSNLKNNNHALSAGLTVTGFDGVCSHLLKKSVADNGDISKITAVCGIPEEIKRKPESAFGETFSSCEDAYVIEFGKEISVYGASKRALLYAAHNIAMKKVLAKGWFITIRLRISEW